MRRKFILISGATIIMLFAQLFTASAAVIPLNSGIRASTETSKRVSGIPSWDIKRIDYIHYAKSEKTVRAPKTPSSGGGYSLSGYKWNTLNINYSLNPAGLPSGLESSWVESTLRTSAETWDNATQKELFNDTSGITSNHYGSLDGTNTIEFGTYSGNNSVIAVTAVWYTTTTREIIEFDMKFNSYYKWGNADNNSSVMDLQNIATHELGHAVGLADVYNFLYSNVTMFGYAGYGETNKRTLEAPDKAGLVKIYGI